MIGTVIGTQQKVVVMIGTVTLVRIGSVTLVMITSVTEPLVTTTVCLHMATIVTGMTPINYMSGYQLLTYGCHNTMCITSRINFL
jgi:hypothetical protein